jgi:dephospho-CoA kinase
MARRDHRAGFCDDLDMSLVIGLTGGIASGKSSVTRMFAALGARVIDADAIVRELQAHGAPLLDEISRAFGSDLIGVDGALDRAALGAIIFRDPDARLRLNSIMHPKVAAEISRRIDSARESGDAVIVVDIPLLFEGQRSGEGTASLVPFDTTIVVWLPEALQIERLLERGGLTRSEAEHRVRAQIPLNEKRRLADHTVDNSGTPEETKAQVRDVFASITASLP